MYNLLAEVEARTRGSTSDPLAIIIIAMIIMVIIAIVIIAMMRRNSSESSSYQPQPVDPSMKDLPSRVSENIEPLSMEDTLEKEEREPLYVSNEDTPSDNSSEKGYAIPDDEEEKSFSYEAKCEEDESNNNDQDQEEETTMATNFWDNEFVLCKLKNGVNVEYIKLLPETVVIRREDGKVDEIKREEVAQFIGNNNECSMSRINGSNDIWLFESETSYSLASEGKIIAKAEKENSSSGYKMLATLKQGDSITATDGTEVATFMCQNKGELLVQFKTTGKYDSLNISEPLQTEDYVLMSVGAATIIVYEKDTEKMEVYTGSLCIGA